MRTCKLVLQLEFVFKSQYLGSLNVLCEKAITAKIKVLFSSWRDCTRGRKLMASWSHPEVKPNKRDSE